MKNMHFCTPGKIREIKYAENGEIVVTHRTGFVPMLYPGDIINLNDRLGKIDTFSCQGEIMKVFPIIYDNIIHSDKLEIAQAYRTKKFSKHHWFFKISIKIMKS